MSSKLLQLSLYVVAVLQLMSFQIANVKARKKQLKSLVTLKVTYKDCMILIFLFTFKSCFDLLTVHCYGAALDRL